ncbi:MAG TPA: bifunctional DNA-formamidopyrimidine glycosylase/DNA-(apurinic or apyrimidinic site) lyase [Candidatus Baltobacteraceae bacterium]
MPELPEVETIARGLAHAICGKTISDVTVVRPKTVSPEPGRFVAELLGERIAGVGRRGKFVVIALGSGRSLVVHLRMTGRLIIQSAPAGPPEPYTTVLVCFADGSRLCFADTRRFGRMRLVGTEEPWAAEVGVEPLSEEFSVERFVSLLRGRRTPIKVFLLDQRRIAGIGNIYACEALWEARIRPSSAAGSISRPAGKRLHAAIRDVLQRAIDLRGTSVDDYVDAEGLRGGFQNQLRAYGRDGQKCLRCGRTIRRTTLSQRGTWWCPGCQKPGTAKI